MEKYESYKSVCPYCGYDEFSPYNTAYIAPGTVLHERYLVGVLMSCNGEGATYIGFDKTIGCKILIREYMPINLCTRVNGKPTISVNYNNLAKYKAFMAEYTELNKSLARLRNNTNINPVLDMFAENNTTYTIFEYIDGVSLLDFLKDNAGELSWEQVSRIFPPLFTTLGILHNAGITHRAVSPETVYITNKGELKLSGFCISAVRTADAGLEYELFRGYAAPEQYSASSSSRQGSWTDVYGVSALLYRMLTGCMPTDSTRRLVNDDLCEPNSLNNNIPPHVSRVIMEGMNLSGRDRIQTITEFVTKLFEQPSPQNDYYIYDERQYDNYDNHNYGKNNTQYNNNNNNNNYADNPADNTGYDDDGYEENYRYEKINTVDKIKVPVIIGILLFVILMIIAMVFLNLVGGGGSSVSSVSSTSSSSVADENVVEGVTETHTETTTIKTDSIMFDLKGKYFETTQEKYAEYFTLEPIYEYYDGDEYEQGQIFAQSVEEGESFNKGDTITVKVSKGKSTATIPDYHNMTATQYESELNKAGITEYSMIAESSITSGTPNTVTQIQVNGENVSPGDTFSNAAGNKLIVYFIPKDFVAATDPPATEAPTEAPTDPPTTEAPTESPTEAPTETPTETSYDEPEETDTENEDSAESE
jgi:serine/threonine-protein kinase